MKTLTEYKKTMSDVAATMEYDRAIVEYMADTASQHDKQDEVFAAFISLIREGNDIEDSCLMALENHT